MVGMVGTVGTVGVVVVVGVVVRDRTDRKPPSLCSSSKYFRIVRCPLLRAIISASMPDRV